MTLSRSDDVAEFNSFCDKESVNFALVKDMSQAMHNASTDERCGHGTNQGRLSSHDDARSFSRLWP